MYPCRTVSDIVELNPSFAYIVQVGGSGNGKTKIWEVAYSSLQTQKKLSYSPTDSTSRFSFEGKEDDSYGSESKFNFSSSRNNSLHSKSNMVDTTSTGSMKSKFHRTSSVLNSLYSVLYGKFAGKFNISVKEIYSVNPDMQEISCCNLTCQASRNYRGIVSTNTTFSLYLGSATGAILKFVFSK